MVVRTPQKTKSVWQNLKCSLTKHKPIELHSFFTEELPAEPEDKPLSIAEEIATEVDADDMEVRERYDLLKQNDTKIAELQKLSMAELIELARSLTKSNRNDQVNDSCR